eukprot:g24389.t1
MAWPRQRGVPLVTVAAAIMIYFMARAHTMLLSESACKERGIARATRSGRPDATSRPILEDSIIVTVLSNGLTSQVLVFA